MVQVAGLRRRSGEAQRGRPKLRLLLLMGEVARLVLEAVLFERRRRRRLMVVDGELLVVVVLLKVLLHEVLVLLVLLVIVQMVVRVRRWPGEEGLRLQRLLGQIGHDGRMLQVTGRRDGGRRGDGRGVRPAIVLRGRVAGAVVVVGAAAAAVGGERSQVAGVVVVTALLALLVGMGKGMEVVIRMVGIPVPVPAVRLVEAHVLEGAD